MPYCVNCGVELDKTASRCALCATKVMHPEQETDTQSPTPYPRKIDTLGMADRRQAALNIALMWVLSSAICVAVNLMFSASGFWAAYPVGALGVVSVCFFFPLLFSQIPVYGFLFIDMCAMLLYIWLIEVLGPTHGWWSAVALPITLIAWMLVCVPVALAKKNVRPVYLFCIGIIEAGALSAAVETFCTLYITGVASLKWSAIVSVVCLSISIMCLAVVRNRRAAQELQRRMHI